MINSTIKYPDIIKLVPDTGIHFIDIDINLDLLRVSKSFVERPDTNPPRFIPLTRDVLTGNLVDDDGKVVPEESAYSTTGAKALEILANEWIPLPFFRIKDRMASARRSYAEGPADWVRGRIVERAVPDREGNTHHLVLAFDTLLEPEVDGRPYAAPSPENAKFGEDYGLASAFADVSWFLRQTWVEPWLSAVFLRFHERRIAPRRFDPAELPHRYEFWGHYLALLELLASSRRVPDVKFVDTISDPARFQPIDVDLVLDVGNSRTCGILVESSGQRPIDLTNAYPLELRDLTRPELVGASPFVSRLEFSRAQFGRAKLARQAGRIHPAFAWPSLVRVGAEAVHLSYLSNGTEGSSGLSSPKRYLWDTEPQPHDWRYNSGGSGAVGERSVTQGAMLVSICDDGEDLEDRRRELQERGDDRQVLPAIDARFSRSSLMTFFLVEIFLQAFMLINSPGKRYQRAHSEAPRTLKRVILTVPTAMPLPERLIFQRRVDNALKYVRRMMRLEKDASGQERAIGLPSKGIIQWDEATGTQMVFLYTELMRSFRGDARWLFEMGGRRRGGSPDPALRVASVDIGGGTTDLIITTYTLAGERAIIPEQNFREGFNTAGDDILRAIIENHVVGALAAAIKDAGVEDAESVLAELLGGNRAILSETERTLRRQFTEQLAIPIGLSLIGLYEDYDVALPTPPIRRTIASFFEDAPAPTPRIVEFIERAVSRAGGAGFSLMAVPINIDLAAINYTAERTIGEALSTLSEAIHRYGCDYLLLSGRSCRMPAITSAFLAKLPVPPDRIRSMHGYKVGGWYPFRDARGQIDDPKTTAAMGALVCTLSQGYLEHFNLRSGDLRMRSTMRFIGIMEQVPQIKDRNVLLREVNLDDPKARRQDCVFKIDTPVVIGFRQLTAERWPATPVYRIDFRRPGELGQNRLPLTVRFAALRSDEDRRSKLFDIEGVEDAQGIPCPHELVLRLQTLRDVRGYWIDTGILITA